MFGERDGHLKDTPQNRKLLIDLANDSSKLQGIDKLGNTWHVEIDDKGRQVWVVIRNGIVRNGGRNNKIISWDDESGLNRNPKKRKNWR